MNYWLVLLALSADAVTLSQTGQVLVAVLRALISDSQQDDGPTGQT